MDVYDVADDDDEAMDVVDDAVDDAVDDVVDDAVDDSVDDSTQDVSIVVDRSFYEPHLVLER